MILHLWLPYLDFGFYPCDFHILTLDFTLALPISWHWILPLWSPCIDLGLDHDEFSLCMMVFCQLCHLCGHCTLQFSLMNCHSLKSLYASCDWHLSWDLIMIDSLLAMCIFLLSNFESNLYTWHCILHFTLIPWHDIVIMKCMSHLYVGPWLHMPFSPLPHVSCLLYLMLCTSSLLHVNFRPRLLWWYCLLHWPWVVSIVLLHFTLISCHDIGNNMMMILVCINLPDWHVSIALPWFHVITLWSWIVWAYCTLSHDSTCQLVHTLRIMRILLADLLDLVQNSLEGMWGDNALFTKTSPCLMAWCLGFLSLYLVVSTLVIAPLDSISWDCASWIVSCVTLPLRGSLTWHSRVQTLFTWDILMLWSIMMMEWTKLTFTNLSSILTLHFVDCTVYMWFTLDLSCRMHRLERKRLCPFRGSLRSDQRVQDPLCESFWSSGLCMMHLDNSWLRS